MIPLLFEGNRFLPGQALALATQLLESQDLDAHHQDFWTLIQNWYNPACNRIALQTSGSTGAPKTLVFSRAAVEIAAQIQLDAIQAWGINTIWLVLPVSKAGGMMLVVRALLAGWNIRIFDNKLNPFKDSDFIPESNEAALLSLLPAQFEAIGGFETSKKVAQSAKVVLLGGGAISHSLEHACQSWGVSNVWQSYGMTETLSFVALRSLSRKEATFYPLPEFRISVTSKGCLSIQLPNSLAQAMELTSIETNDLIHLLEDGSFKVLGREDEVINSGGLKLFPLELEAELMQLMEEIPYQVCVVPIKDERWGQRPCWVFEKELPEMDDLNHWSASVPSHHRPANWTVLESFPVNEGGKIDRRKIRWLVSENN